MLMMLKKYGIQDDESQEKVPYFLNEIYTRCREVGLTPQQVFDYIGDILKFSSEIPISEIPKFLKKRIEEKEELESEVQALSIKRDELAEIKEELEQEVQGLRNSKEIRTKTYRTFMMAKSELKQYRIQMEDLDLFVKCVAGVSREGYNAVQIVTKIADYENLEKNLRYYKEEINFKKDELAKLNQDIDRLQKNLNYLKIKLEIIEELELRGFNIKELRTLYNMLNEMGRENDFTYEKIRNDFFEDVKNYEEVIGGRKDRDRLKNECKFLEEQTMKEREKYNSYPKVIESIIGLAGAGIYEADIVKINKILSMSDYYYQDEDQTLSKEALINDLKKYRNLKLAIKNLENMTKNLNSKKKTQYKSRTKKSTVNNNTKK
jgi:DNA-binding transcriptional MerR regulator